MGPVALPSGQWTNNGLSDTETRDSGIMALSPHPFILKGGQRKKIQVISVLPRDPKDRTTINE